jgi:HEAT repeat protein
MRKLLGIVFAIFVLVLSADAADVKELVKKLKEKDPEVRREAVRELSDLGPEAKEALAELVKALRDNDLFVRRFSAQALGNIGPDAAKDALPSFKAIVISTREDKEVQEAVVVALGKMGKNGVNLLILTVKDPGKDTDVRRKAVESLGILGPDAHESVKVLLDALKGGAMKGKTANPSDLRIEVVTALGNIATPSDDAVMKALEGMAGDKGLRKQKALKEALNKALKDIKKRTAS